MNKISIRKILQSFINPIKHNFIFNNYNNKNVVYFSRNGYDNDYKNYYSNSDLNIYGSHYDRNGYDSYNDNPRKSKKGKGFSWTIMGSILGVAAIAGGIAGLALYISNKNTTQVNKTNDLVDDYYQKSQTTTSLAAMQYIFQRTISMQFIFGNKTTGKGSLTLSGTGWIFNKEQDKPIYYVATNLHVAAGLTYENQTVFENGESTTFGDIVATYIGFISPKTETSMENKYSSNSLSMLRVNTPKIVYTATTDNDVDGFGTAYQSIYGASANNIASKDKAAVDFSVLKFDFTSTNLTTLNQNMSRSRSENVSQFETWLKYYDTTPTKFYESPIEDIQSKITIPNNQNKFFPKLYMGGFPGTNNNANGNIFPGSYSDNGNYLNNGGTSWEGFGDFTLSIQNPGTTLHLPSNVTWSNYNTYAGTGFSSFKNGLNNSGSIPYFKTEGQFNYFNVGYYALIDANSLGGSSGSMIITNISTDEHNPDFRVVGIYWGEIEYNEAGPQTSKNNTHVGVGNFLWIKGYQVGMYQAPEYNIFDYAIKAIKKDSMNATLVYNPTFTTSTNPSKNI